jgi:hypothetical protein
MPWAASYSAAWTWIGRPGKAAFCLAMVEMEVRIRDGGHVARGDAAGAQQIGQVADDRLVCALDLVVPGSDARVEQQHAVGMDDRVGHDDAHPTGKRAPIRMDEVGDVERLDPDGGWRCHGSILDASLS